MNSRWDRAVPRLRHTLFRSLPALAQTVLDGRPPPWVGRFAVPLPAGRTLRLVSPRSHRSLSALYWRGPGSYEPVTAATWWCLSVGADVVVDVGAYVGYYALLATSAGAATVHAFEPNPPADVLLREAVRINDVAGRVHVHPIALGAEDGSTRLHTPRRPANPLPTTPAIHQTKDETDGLRVPVARLDSVLAEDPTRVSLIKLDVEGGELAALRGAELVVEAAQPDIILEIIAEQTPSPAVRWLRGRDYRIFDLTPQGPIPLAAAAAPSMRNARDSTRHRYGEVLASTSTDRAISQLGDMIRDLNWPDNRSA